MIMNVSNRPHLCQRVPCDGLESHLNVDGLLGRCFKVRHVALALAPLLRALGGHYAVLQVNLITNVLLIA